jgi:hypothetical protein
VLNFKSKGILGVSGFLVSIGGIEMITERAQKVWEAFCGELIDNGVKDSEDVRQGLSTAIREVVNLSNEWVEFDGDGWNISNVVYVDAIMEIADELEAL